MNEKSKILIIEDDTDLVAALKIMLEAKNYKVTASYDPAEGKEKIMLEKPDLIILDVMFGSRGESKGFDFVQNLRTDKKFSDIPVLMLTAINAEKPFFNFTPDIDNEFLPVDSFIDKPLQSDEFFSKVEELLSKKVSRWKNWPEKAE